MHLLVSGGDITEPRPSPDGVLVAFVQRWKSAAAVSVVPIHGGPERIVAMPVDPSPGRGLGGGCLAWLPTGDGLVVAAVDGELWQVDLGGAERRLTSAGRTCRAPSVAPDGSCVVAAVDEAEIWKIDLNDLGVMRLDDGRDAFCFDPVVSPDGNAVSWQGWSPPDMAWDASHRVTAALTGIGGCRRSGTGGGDGAVQQPRFMPDGRPICVHDGSGWLNVSVENSAVVAERYEHAGPTWGMGQRSYAVSPDGTAIAFNRNEAGFGRLCIADVSNGEVRQLARGVHGQIEWMGDSITALRTGARTPTQVVAYRVDTGDRRVLAVGPPTAWDSLDLPEPDLVEVEAGGATLHARRFAAGLGRMICWVHGGPTDQWMVDFRPRISYWWSRGWDVLVVDPRGSTGHGRRYQRALNGRWGRLDVDDTAAIVSAAHDWGWATPSTTVAMGGSSGGLTVLGVLADHAGLFAGGVVSYPVSDLRALAEVTHRFEAHYTDTLVGPASDRDLFERLSPISRADRIRGPLLVFHGSEDPVVPLSQSRHLVDICRRAGAMVELVEYDGEGHGFRDPANVRDEYERTSDFLDTVVSRAQPAR